MEGHLRYRQEQQVLLQAEVLAADIQAAEREPDMQVALAVQVPDMQVVPSSRVPPAVAVHHHGDQATSYLLLQSR
jgi:hypothetical protein